jgi:hypothetical protein
MGQIILSWDCDFPKYVDSQRGSIIRPINMDPIVTELVVRLLFNPTYNVGTTSVVTFNHWKHIPFADWTEEVLGQFAHNMLNELNFVHERHCTLELYSSSSTEYCK